MKHPISILIIALTSGMLLVAPMNAQQKAKDEKPSAGQKERSPKPKPNSGMTKAREAAALAFVREHHEELESLLIQLKESQPKQYEQAVRDLFRTSERLAMWQEKDPPRHKLELRAWQARSRIQLLTAMLLMSPQDKRTASELKESLQAEVKVRREILLLERERTSKRLERIDAQIQSIDMNSEKLIERRVKQLIQGSHSPEKASTRSVD